MRRRWRKTFRNYSRYNPDTEHQFYQVASGKPYVGAGWDGFSEKHPLHTGKDDSLVPRGGRGFAFGGSDDTKFHFYRDPIGIGFLSNVDIFKDSPSKMFDKTGKIPMYGHVPYKHTDAFKHKEAEWNQRQQVHHEMRFKMSNPDRDRFIRRLDMEYRNNPNYYGNTNSIHQEYFRDVAPNPEKYFKNVLNSIKVDGKSFSFSERQNMDQE